MNSTTLLGRGLSALRSGTRRSKGSVRRGAVTLTAAALLATMLVGTDASSASAYAPDRSGNFDIGSRTFGWAATKIDITGAARSAFLSVCNSSFIKNSNGTTCLQFEVYTANAANNNIWVASRSSGKFDGVPIYTTDKMLIDGIQAAQVPGTLNAASMVTSAAASGVEAAALPNDRTVKLAGGEMVADYQRTGTHQKYRFWMTLDAAKDDDAYKTVIVETGDGAALLNQAEALMQTFEAAKKATDDANDASGNQFGSAVLITLGSILGGLGNNWNEPVAAAKHVLKSTALGGLVGAIGGTLFYGGIWNANDRDASNKTQSAARQFLNLIAAGATVVPGTSDEL